MTAGGIRLGLMRGSPSPWVIDRLQGLERVGTPRQAQGPRAEAWKDDLAQRRRLIEKHDEENWKLDLARRRVLLDELEVDCLYSSGRCRAATTLLRDGVFPTRFLKAREGREKRMDALVEVLCSVPEADYKQLGDMFRTGAVLVSIPEDTTHGHILRLATRYNCEFYLSPILEDRSVAWVRYVAAHEAAHLLYHIDLAGSTDRKEREADAAAARWGFLNPR